MTSLKKSKRIGKSLRAGRSAVQDRVGAAAVEFAVVAPLMIGLTLGMMEVGRMVMVKQLLVNVAREGARLAVLPDVDVADVEADVSQQLQDLQINDATITVSPNPLDGVAAGTPVTVSISVPATSITWIPKPLFSVQKTIATSTTMRREAP